jgi:uncharacterized protein (TIGR03435 family)
MRKLLFAAGLLTLSTGLGALGQEQGAKTSSAAQTLGTVSPLPSFDVSSVRENKSGGPGYSNFPLNYGPQFGVQDGLLIVRNTGLLQLLVFAYKPDMFQIQRFRANLPDWARSARFDIQARANSRPGKDEMRLMMQSLLAERFGLKAHHEMRELPVYALAPAKPGKWGPMLKAHAADDPACSKMKIPEAVAGAYPSGCGVAASIPAKTAGDTAIGGYNMTMETVAPALGGSADITDRPVVDKTGLAGTFDFTIEFVPAKNGGVGGDAAAQTDVAGPTFVEALKEQLGLKLVPQTAMVDVVVIDRLERPSGE